MTRAEFGSVWFSFGLVRLGLPSPLSGAQLQMHFNLEFIKCNSSGPGQGLSSNGVEIIAARGRLPHATAPTLAHTFVIWRIRGGSTHPHLSQSWAWACRGLRADPLNRWIPMSTFLIYFCQSACPASLTDFKTHLSVCLSVLLSSSSVIYINFCLQQLNFHCFYAFMLHLDSKTEWTHSTVAGKFKCGVVVVVVFHSTYLQHHHQLFSFSTHSQLALQIFCSILLWLCSKWAVLSCLPDWLMDSWEIWKVMSKTE